MSTTILALPVVCFFAATCAAQMDQGRNGISGRPAGVREASDPHAPVRQDIDLEYQCVILATPSSSNEAPALPTGLIEIDPGETFYVEFWATDSGTTNSGIVSAYTDLGYQEQCVTAGDVVHSTLFSLFPSGTDDGSAIDDLGGSQLAGGVGVEPQWARVAHVVFTEQKACAESTFQLAPADWESSAFGRGEIPTSSIGYGSCGVTVRGYVPVPAVSTWGLILMFAALVMAGTIVVRRRQVRSHLQR